MTDEQQGEAWAELMRASLAGNNAAYRQLLGALAHAFRNQARAMLSRAGSGNSDVEDIVQEALLAVHLKRETWESSRPFAPWAYAVLRYKVLDRMRQQRKRSTLPLEDAYAVASPVNESGDTLDAGRMLAHLGEPQRRLVQALTMEGRSAAEVAGEIGSTEGAVRVALHRALKKLAKIYREYRE